MNSPFADILYSVVKELREELIGKLSISWKSEE